MSVQILILLAIRFQVAQKQNFEGFEPINQNNSWSDEIDSMVASRQRNYKIKMDGTQNNQDHISFRTTKLNEVWSGPPMMLGELDPRLDPGDQLSYGPCISTIVILTTKPNLTRYSLVIQHHIL